jgi:hypothetical protein
VIHARQMPAHSAQLDFSWASKRAHFSEAQPRVMAAKVRRASSGARSHRGRRADSMWLVPMLATGSQPSVPAWVSKSRCSSPALFGLR